VTAQASLRKASPSLLLEHWQGQLRKAITLYLLVITLDRRAKALLV
jgi:hypothetical protein